MQETNPPLRSASLVDAVEQALAADSRTARYSIGVEAEGAMITLTGQVDRQAVKEAAEQVARHVDGVVTVTSEIVVRGR